MANKPKKLSDTAREPLTVAATRGDHLIRPPKLPIAAARQVVRSLLGAGLAEEMPVRVDDPDYAWRTSEDGEVLMLRATALGLARVGEGETGTPTPEPIAAQTWETTGACRRRSGRAGTARYGLGRIRLPAGSGRPGGCQRRARTLSKRCNGTATPPRPRWSGLGPSRRGGYDTAGSSRRRRPSSMPGTHVLAVMTTSPTR